MITRTSKEVEQEFRADLAELLKRYNAELTIIDDCKPVCEIYIPPVWDDRIGYLIQESTCFTL
jgi:hypothetical protein